MKKLLLLCSIFALIACSDHQTDSSIQAGTHVRILRDEYGVPHIYADSIYGLYYGYGYSIAQDRLFQMDMTRRSTQGLVAEVLGPNYLDFDINARQIFSPDSIRQQLENLKARDKDIFEGYAAGLNAWLDKIATSSEALMPKQFLDYGFKPQPWTAYDVVMIFVGTMANRYGDFNTELDNLNIIQTLEAQHGREKALALFDLLNPRYTEGAPTTVPLENWNRPVPDVLAAPDVTTVNYEQLIEVSDNPLLANYAAFTSPVISGISNCWVLGKDKVSEGNAILVNGPQFGWFEPAYTYSVGMHGAGIDVVGNTPFGYPMVMFGHNDSIAWGSTWAAGDIVDIFAEQLNPENPDQYWYKGEYLDMESRTEVIGVLGQNPVTVEVYRSIHGPIIHRDEDAEGQQTTAYAKKRAWDGRELETLLAWLYATWAKDYGSWVVQAEKSAINVNMYFADVDGNIGYFFGGHYPQRAPGHDNRIPAKGDGSMDWQGRLKPSWANPNVFNPVGGYLANWNNKSGQGVMNPDEFWFGWTEADRVDYLRDAIEQQPQFSADQAWDLIRTSSYADLHLRYLSDLIEQSARLDEQLDEAAGIIQSWNGYYEDKDSDGYYDSAAPAIFRGFVAHLIEQVLADDLGDIYGFFASTGYPEPGKPTAAGTNIQTGFKALYEAIKRPGDMSNLGYDLLNGVEPVELVSASLRSALDELTEQQGDRMSDWKLAVDPRPYGKKNFLGIPQDFDLGPLIEPYEQNRGTENNMTIMKPGAIVGYEVVPPGQNAFISPDGNRAANFDDQLQMYTDFGKKRMWFYAPDVEANAVSETILSLAKH